MLCAPSLLHNGIQKEFSLPRIRRILSWCEISPSVLKLRLINWKMATFSMAIETDFNELSFTSHLAQNSLYSHWKLTTTDRWNWHRISNESELLFNSLTRNWIFLRLNPEWPLFQLQTPIPPSGSPGALKNLYAIAGENAFTKLTCIMLILGKEKLLIMCFTNSPVSDKRVNFWNT